MPTETRELRLARRPEGLPDAGTWDITSATLPDPEDGQLLVRVTHLSLDPARISRNAYGVVYEIDGPIKTPSGTIARFVSIWQIDTGSDVPRFITMYPR